MQPDQAHDPWTNAKYEYEKKELFKLNFAEFIKIYNAGGAQRNIGWVDGSLDIHRWRYGRKTTGTGSVFLFRSGHGQTLQPNTKRTQTPKCSRCRKWKTVQTKSNKYQKCYGITTARGARARDQNGKHTSIRPNAFKFFNLMTLICFHYGMIEEAAWCL